MCLATRRIFCGGRGRGTVRRGKSRKIFDRHAVGNNRSRFAEGFPVVFQRGAHSAQRLQEFHRQSQRVHGETAVPVPQPPGAAGRRQTGKIGSIPGDNVTLPCSLIHNAFSVVGRTREKQYVSKTTSRTV